MVPWLHPLTLGGSGLCFPHSQECLWDQENDRATRGLGPAWLEAHFWKQRATLRCVPPWAPAPGTLWPSAAWRMGPELLHGGWEQCTPDPAGESCCEKRVTLKSMSAHSREDGDLFVWLAEAPKRTDKGTANFWVWFWLVIFWRAREVLGVMEAEVLSATPNLQPC